MNFLLTHPWVQQAIVAWGSGPLALALFGFHQWRRDRKDRLSKTAYDKTRDQHTDEETREAIIDESFHRLSKDQQDFIINLRMDRDSLRKRCDELEAENRRIHETIWNIILHDRDMRNAALTARIISDQQAIRLREPAHFWPELTEWKS